MEGLQSNLTYAQSLADQSDILAIQEHWLYGFETNVLQDAFPNHCIAANFSDQEQCEHNLETTRRKGGIAIIWKKELDKSISAIQEGSNRLQALSLKLPGSSPILTVNTYMPTNGSVDHVPLYQSILDEILELSRTHSDHHLLWMGDLNGSLIRKNSKHDLMLQNFTKELELAPSTQSEQKTFFHFNKLSSSQIDYILTGESLKSVCTNYTIKEREPGNVSSHDPVQLNLQMQIDMDIQGPHKKQPVFAPRPNWTRIDKESYQELTHEHLEALLQNGLNLSLEDKILQTEKILIESAEKSTEDGRKHNPKRKTPWTPRMSEISKQEKHQFWLWKNEGKPRDPENQTFLRLCALKKLFRKEQRTTAALQRNTLETKLMESQDGDQKLFYKLIKKQRSSADDLPNEMIFNGKLASGEELITALETYFSRLATPEDCPQYDEKYKTKADFRNSEQRRIYEENPIRILPNITPQIALEAINSLNCRKAPDPSGLMAEHLVYSSPLIASVLADIMNNIIQKQKIPAILKHGCITPVFKKKNSPRNPDNYRRITITLLISKVLEKILQYPLKTIMAPNLNKLQRGFTEGSSSTNTAFILSEAIADSHDQNKPLFTLFLDASKAFDVVYHASMLNHLHELYITGDLWVLLNDTYDGMTSAIKWKGQMSSTFYEKQGIRQGGVNSTEMFKGRGNPFLVTVQKAGIGKTIGSIFVGAPTCADDVALVADSTLDLQTLAELAWVESARERFKYSDSKSKTMTFHQKRKVPALQYPVVMGRKEIEPSVQETHLGIVRTPDNKADAAVLDRIKTARRTSYSLLGLGMRRMSQVHPSTSLKLLSSYIQPSLTFGFETLRTTPQNLLKMETFYRGILRRMQNLPDETASCALHILLGTLPLEAHLDTQVLSLFARLLHLPDSIEQEILCRQLSIKDIHSASWTQ